jgi:hypothetical protein
VGLTARSAALQVQQLSAAILKADRMLAGEYLKWPRMASLT